MNTTFWEIELNDGQVTRLSLTFGTLLRLRESGPKGKGIYEKYMAIRNAGSKDELDTAYLIYTAYVCAHLEDYMELMDFLDLMPTDRETIFFAVDMLLMPEKKKQDLAKRSERPQKRK